MSSLKYGRPRAQVEQAIFKRLESSEPAKPKLPPSAGASSRKPGLPSAGGAAAQPASGVPGAKPSFLDEWLEKRKTRMASTGGTAGAQTTASKPPAKPSQRLSNDVDSLFNRSAAPATSQSTAAPAGASLPPVDSRLPQPVKPAQTPPPAADGTQHMAHDNELVIDRAATSGAAPKPKVTSGVPAQQPDQLAKAEQKPKKLTKDDIEASFERTSQTQSKTPPKQPSAKQPEHDESEIENMSEVLRASLRAKAEREKQQAQSGTKPESAQQEIGEDDDLYIDKDGNIHYKDEKPAQSKQSR